MTVASESVRRPSVPGWALALVLCLLSAAAGAAPDPRDAADVARIEAYLNDMRSLRASFIQIAPDGRVAEGTLSLERPGRVRFEYLPPSPVLIVGDGKWLVLYDAELDSVTQVKIDDTPLKLLLAPEIRFADHTTLEQVDREPGIIRFVLSDKEHPEEGAITLVFTEAPLLLRQWLVRDPQGQITSVYFNELQVNPVLDPGLFVFLDPNPFRDDSDR